MVDELVTIRDVAQLQALDAASVRKPPRGMILELPGLSAEDAHAAGERLARYANECGCDLGSKCMLAGFVVALAWVGVDGSILSTRFLYGLGWPVLAAFVAAIIGKAVGIARARVRLQSEIRKLITITNPSGVISSQAFRMSPDR